MDNDKPAARSYFGWQNEKSNFLFGLSARRAALVGAAALLAIWPFAMAQGRLVTMLWPVAAVLVVMAFVRVHGRSLDEWLIAWTSYHMLVWRQAHKFLSGPFRPSSARARNSGAGADLPGVLAPLSFLEAPATAGGEALALAHHHHDGTYTAVARIKFSGIGLADTQHKDRRVGAWGNFVAGLCTEAHLITRIQVLQRLVPESAAALRSWHDEHLSPHSPQLATEVTERMLATASVATNHRDAYIAVTLDARRAGGQIKNAGGGHAGAATVLRRQLTTLEPQLADAELHVEAWLGVRDLAEVIRTTFDPHAAPALGLRRAAAEAGHDGLEAGVDPEAAGPIASWPLPGSYVHNGGRTAVYWVQQWPRSRVYSTVLAPLLGDGQYRRSLSMSIQPLPPRLAEREVMKERTSRSVAVRMRQKTGQITPEHERTALERAQDQDSDRAAGHGLARYTGYVAVTVTNPDQLENACVSLEADAAAARIEIQRMWHTQDHGFAAAVLPLGFGLPEKRW